MVPTNFIFTAELSSAAATSSSYMSEIFPRKKDNDVIQQHVSEAFVLNSDILLFRELVKTRLKYEMTYITELT